MRKVSSLPAQPEGRGSRVIEDTFLADLTHCLIPQPPPTRPSRFTLAIATGFPVAGQITTRTCSVLKVMWTNMILRLRLLISVACCA